MLNNREQINLYFLGSGELAIPVLRSISKSEKINLIGCATQKDKLSGRKKSLTPTPVGRWAYDNKLPIKKVHSVNENSFLDELRFLNPDIILVVSFGQIIKRKLLSLPPFGCINIHPSLLPRYRGAAPISASILNGDLETGISIMKMTKNMDSGPIYHQFKYKLTNRETAKELEQNLGNLAAKKINSSILDIINGKQEKNSQDHSKAIYVGKVKKEDGQIFWDKYSAEYIERMTRAYYPWPGAYFKLQTSKRTVSIKIVEAKVVPNQINTSGKVIQADKNKWLIACKRNALEIKKVVPGGKKEMSGPEFLMGCQIKTGELI